MKKLSLKRFILFLIPIILLSSCNKDNVSNYTYSLSMDNSIITYSQYDLFNKEDIKVYKNTYLDNDLIESNVISDYEIYLTSDNSLLDNGYIFSQSGLINAYIKASDVNNLNFTFKIENSKNMSQKLILNSAPNKTKYNLNESFDKEGLSIGLYLEYYTSENKKIVRTETIDDFKLYIDNISASNYIYNEYGIKRVNVKYTGLSKTLDLYFSTFCLKNNYSPTTIENKELMEEEDTLLNLTISNSNYTKENKLITPDEIELDYTLHEFSNNNLYTYQRYTPSIGNTPILVIPIVIPGYESEATKENYEVIKKCFIGSSNELNYESLHSYYYKSSYGALDFSFTILDYYYLDTDSTKFNTLSSLTDSTYTDTIYELSKDALSYAKNTYSLDLTEFDTDNNGAIDSIWMVYMCPYKTRGDTFWAFSGYGNETLNKEDPVSNTYGWISIDFLKGEYTIDETNNPDSGLDAHVLIHETGHMLGLNDYYDTNKIDEISAINDPLGSIDMMSSDLGDMNPYSKLILGWIKPYIVLGSAILSIKSFQSKDNIILIYDDNKDLTYFNKTNENKYILNIFDEYLILDYYTPKGLNESDYPSYNVTTVKESGLRIYHADNRLTKLNYINNEYTFTILEDPNIVLDYQNKDLYRGITNSLYETISLNNDLGFDEIRWISTNKTRLNYNSDTQNRIFKENEEFNLTSDDLNFIDGKFNNNSNCSYLIKINSIS